MSAKVTKLHEQCTRRLSGGQVITSVGSVIKELSENSLDAGATIIDVVLDRSIGFGQCSIIDNGRGVDAAEAEVMCQKSYTSKLDDFDDLQSLVTFGFRGEALNAICNVAAVSIASKTHQMEYGFTYTFDNNGQITKKMPVPCQTGTRVLVERLFYNMPVRRRSGQALASKLERAVVDLIDRFALSRHTCALSVQVEGRGFLRKYAAVVNLPERIRQVFGTDIAKCLQHAAYSNPKLRASMDLWMPRLTSDATAIDYQCATRSTADQLHVFVNGRILSCPELARIAHQCFQTACAVPDRYAVGCLMLIVQPSQIDVNVQADKSQVLFVDSNSLSEWIQQILNEFYSFNISDSGSSSENVSLAANKPMPSGVETNIVLNGKPLPDVFSEKYVQIIQQNNINLESKTVAYGEQPELPTDDFNDNFDLDICSFDSNEMFTSTARSENQINHMPTSLPHITTEATLPESECSNNLPCYPAVDCLAEKSALLPDLESAMPVWSGHSSPLHDISATMETVDSERLPGTLDCSDSPQIGAKRASESPIDSRQMPKQICAPSRLDPFSLFSHDYGRKLRSENRYINFVELSRKIKEKWRSLTVQEKHNYNYRSKLTDSRLDQSKWSQSPAAVKGQTTLLAWQQPAKVTSATTYFVDNHSYQLSSRQRHNVAADLSVVSEQFKRRYCDTVHLRWPSRVVGRLSGQLAICEMGDTTLRICVVDLIALDRYKTFWNLMRVYAMPERRVTPTSRLLPANIHNLEVLWAGSERAVLEQQLALNGFMVNCEAGKFRLVAVPECYELEDQDLAIEELQLLLKSFPRSYRPERIRKFFLAETSRLVQTRADAHHRIAELRQALGSTDWKELLNAKCPCTGQSVAIELLIHV